MAKIKFEVGKRYYDNYGRLHTCTKRTDKSVWFNGHRFVLHGYSDMEYVNGAYRIQADNYDDIEVQSKRAIKELLQAIIKVCANEPCEFLNEEEEFVYQTANDLKEGIEDYLKSIEKSQ